MCGVPAKQQVRWTLIDAGNMNLHLASTTAKVIRQKQMPSASIETLTENHTRRPSVEMED